MKSRRVVTYKAAKEEVFDMNEFLSNSVKNLLYNILNDVEFLTNFGKKNSCFYTSNLREFMTIRDKILGRVGYILFKEKVRWVAFYFLTRKAATPQILQHEFGIHYRTLYRILRDLEAFGLIHPITKINENRRGRKVKVYATSDASEEDIKKAITLHMKLLSPKYRIAEKLAQTLLTDYITKTQSNEITFREIIITIREIKIPYNKHDIAEIVAKILEEKGIKVWR